MSAIVRSYERSTHDHCISQNSRKAQQKSLVAPLTNRNERETRTISSHRTVIRKAHRLLGQKMNLRYPRASRAWSVRMAARMARALALSPLTVWERWGSCGMSPSWEGAWWRSMLLTKDVSGSDGVEGRRP